MSKQAAVLKLHPKPPVSPERPDRMEVEILNSKSSPRTGFSQENLRQLTRRHSKSRMALRAAYWELNDRAPALFCGHQVWDLWARDKTFTDGKHSYRTVAELDVTAEAYRKHRQLKGGKLTQFERRLEEHRELLREEITVVFEKDERSGRHAALIGRKLAVQHEEAAWRDLKKYVENDATAAELSTFAHYVSVAERNDLKWHIGEYRRRVATPQKVPLPACIDLERMATRRRPEALQLVAKCLRSRQ